MHEYDIEQTVTPRDLTPTLVSYHRIISRNCASRLVDTDDHTFKTPASSRAYADVSVRRAPGRA